jgi:hypothetical protein
MTCCQRSDALAVIACITAMSFCHVLGPPLLLLLLLLHATPLVTGVFFMDMLLTRHLLNIIYFATARAAGLAARQQRTPWVTMSSSVIGSRPTSRATTP